MMSQHSQHSHTNGASLEDCHTNFFALTDLCGIKWHVFTWECNSTSDPLEDPVLKSYSRCLSANLMCVWRRTWQHPLDGVTGVPPHAAHAANRKRHSLRYAPKELWIFWYGDEPDLSALLAPELTKSDGIQGSWDWETGLTYEFRTILFKALHNLIERCLLTREFVRLGKWFVQPYDGPENVLNNSSTNLSFSLSFFIHGESTVCASVDVRQHPPARRLTKAHIAAAQQTPQGIPVILGPYGMKGNLTGVTYRSNEPHTQKILEDWKKYFPLESQCSFSGRDASNEIGVAPVVEVIVGGYKLRYPSAYVLVTDMDNPQMSYRTGGCTSNVKEETIKTHEEITEASAYASDRISPFTASTHTLLTPRYLQKAGRDTGLAREMSEHIWQDVIQLPGNHTQNSNDGLTPEATLTTAELAGQWEFNDPALKVGCHCSKCKNEPDATNNTKSGRGCEVRVSNHASGAWLNAKGQPVAPFHWRSPPSPLCVANSLSGQSDSDMLQATARVSNTNTLNASNTNSFNGYKNNSIATPGSVPSLRMSGLTDHPPSVDSPTSVTPSPLPTPRTPHSHNITNHVDHNIPGMSPCPPSNASVLDANTPHQMDSVDNKQNVMDMIGPKSTSSLSQGMSPYPGSLEGTPCKNVPEVSEMQVESVVPECQASIKDTAGGLLSNSLRKPFLQTTDYRSLAEQETQRINVNNNKIYDWLKFPVKKFRPAESKVEQELWPPYRPKHIAQLFQANTDTNKFECDGGIYLYKKISGVKRPLDQYNFEDGVTQFETKIKEEKDDSKGGDPHSPSKKLGNLYTIEGLVPKASDLDTIFDSPVEDYPGHTPPRSNTPVSNAEDSTMPNKLTSNGNLVQRNTSNSNFELTQLSKMYPTPPSLEHNPDHDATMEEGVVHLAHVKQEPIDENMHNHDLSYNLKEDSDCSNYPVIYRPSTVAPFIISDAYKPLPDLPSKMDKELAILPNAGVYNPSWQSYHPPEKNLSVMHNANGHVPPPINHVPLGPSSAPRIGLSPISPLTSVDASHRGPASVGPASIGAIPSNYELPSPASNNSSYLNKTLPSVEPPAASFFHVPETNALMVNIALQDSSINLFKDHNFDSCTMCVCNNNNDKVVGNIRGSDGSLYLPPSQLSSEEECITCSCGFSAVVNRKLAYQSGLFYEDEVDLTGIHEKLIIEPKKSFVSFADPKAGEHSDLGSLDNIPQFIFELVQRQSLVTLCTPCSVLCKAISVHKNSHHDFFNAVEYSDGNEITHLALDQSRLDYSSHSHLDYEHQRNYNRQCVMHKWVYLQFDCPACSQDMVRCMKALQPYLQEAIQKKRSTRLWEPVYNVSGPLTWRQIHRMAPRGTEDMAEPLPIPVLLTGHEKDWLSVAPHSIRHWEKLLLEPYSQPRNIAYVVVSPDNGFVLNHVKNFFKELSSIYELCRLGKHAPIRRALVDGIMRVNKRSASKVANESIDHWFTMLADSQIFSKLKTYSQICCHTLAPHLATLNLDKSLFESGSSRPAEHKQTPSPMPPPCGESSVNNIYSSPSITCENDAPQCNNIVGSTPVGFGPGSSLVEVDEDDSPPPAIMVYLIDPFTVAEDQPDLHRLITLGLMRCFKTMIEKLPEAMQNHVHVQIISLESILELAHDSHDEAKRIDQQKALAFSVFMQCRRILSHTSNVRSLTGFGPASVFDQFLKPDRDMEPRNLNPYGVFSPAYILAPVKESKGRHKEAEEAIGDPREKSTIIYCTYCLSEDQRWLLATATDELGEILETICINIEIPNRTRRRKASARRHGLRKLMDWILGIMSIGVIPWRLVIGRMGRMGHGELKGWWSLLSRKCLTMASKSLRELCNQCGYLFPQDAPCILSACVVSLEPDSAFRMMPDMFTPDERFGQNSKNCNLSTPQDATCTHILVFPTSATAQSAQRFQDDSAFNFEEEGDINFIEGEEMDGMGGGMGIGSIFHDIFSEDTAPTQDIDNLEDGRLQQDSLSQPGSPHIGGGSSRTALNYSGQARSNGIVMADPQEEFCGSGLQQQPLALGYYVSTASTGSLPHWFWSSCPHLQYTCPTFLKSALHLNQPAVTQAEDYMHSATTKVHPLDSTCTADVLRFVLEGYNSLSWLVVDPATQDRRSCLPLHMQALSHLYNLMASLI